MDVLLVERTPIDYRTLELSKVTMLRYGGPSGVRWRYVASEKISKKKPSEEG
jgi:hypothetical protein